MPINDMIELYKFKNEETQGDGINKSGIMKNFICPLIIKSEFSTSKTIGKYIGKTTTQ